MFHVYPAETEVYLGRRDRHDRRHEGAKRSTLLSTGLRLAPRTADLPRPCASGPGAGDDRRVETTGQATSLVGRRDHRPQLGWQATSIADHGRGVNHRGVFPSGSSNTFQDVISGRSERWSAAVLRGCLRLAEVPYTWAVEYRNRRFDSGRTPDLSGSGPRDQCREHHRGRHGQDAAGGLAGPLADGARPASRADQPRIQGADASGRMTRHWNCSVACPHVPHLQDPDRVAAARPRSRCWGAT